MLSARGVKAWSAVHTWSSLACSLFMLLLCVTGLPLVFHDELRHLVHEEVRAPVMPLGTAHISLDRVLAVASARYPQRVVQFASQEEESTDVWYVTMTPTPAPTDDFKQVAVDARTGDVLPSPPVAQGLLWVTYKLHVDLFAGEAGRLFLGATGALLLLAIVSGVVLYGPFTRKLAFGAVRHHRSQRVRWLDLHNLTGIVLLAWLTVVSATGVINAGSQLLLNHWQGNEVAQLLGRYRGQPVLPAGQRASVQSALDAALKEVPGTKVSFIAFPGTSFSSAHHTTFYLRGTEPLTSKLPTPVLVDAATAQVTAAAELPWYLTTLLLSQPLHFGDYGGFPLKVLWALLDLFSIVVLGSGLYLWVAKRRPQPEGNAAGVRSAA